MKKLEEREWYKKAEKAYNEGAKIWNSLPGSKLIWPQDRFKITYCYHSLKDRVPVIDWVEYPSGERKREIVQPMTCNLCGYPYPGVYDDVE
jgi:hypothetical protein